MKKSYFEYDNGNSKIATTCINTLKEKDLNRELISIDEVQRLLLEQDIPIEIAKELAVIILRECRPHKATWLDRIECISYRRHE